MTICWLVFWTLLLPDGSYWPAQSDTPFATKEEALTQSLRIIKRYKGHEPWVQLMTLNIKEAACPAKGQDEESEKEEE